MSDPNAKRTTVHVGTPQANCNAAWETVEVIFHGFKDLPSGRGEHVEARFSCLGREWTLRLYPGGDLTSRDGYVSLLGLAHRSDGCIDLRYTFGIRDREGYQVVHIPGGDTFQSREEGRLGLGNNGNARHFSNFVKRSALLNALRAGPGMGYIPLIVEVNMMQVDGAGIFLPAFLPENLLCGNILKRFNDEETGDVLFEVGDESKCGARKKAKEAVLFHAHRFILRDSATLLAELSLSADGKVPEAYFRANAKEIIDASDKYGVTNLKLEAEACYVGSIGLCVDNVMDSLLYADSKNCALLKEVAVDPNPNGKEVLDKVCFDDVPGALMKDLLTATTRGKEGSNGDESGNDYTTMRVSALRRKLHEKGLDIDGSREAMIALLKENTPPVEEEPNPAGDPMEENP